MKLFSALLMIFGLVTGASAESVHLMNQTNRDLTNLEVKFENQKGVFSVEKLDKLERNSDDKISVNRKGIPAGDGTYILSFLAEGKPYSFRFGYGPATGTTHVLLGKNFTVASPGAPLKPIPGASDDLVLVAWVD